MNARGIVFAGGGTGGHLYPAVAVLERLRELEPGLQPRFLCSTRQIDERILLAQGVLFQPIPAAPLSSRPLGLARFVWSWGGAVRASRAAIQRLRAECGGGPLRVLSTGGFVAAPVVQAARVERIPVVLLNQDAPPGKANRWIARHASQVFTAAQVDRPAWVRIPPVVRRAALAPADRAECRRRLGLDPDRPVLFVTGASQGSRSVNEFLGAFLQAHGPAMVGEGWQVVHQTGSLNNDACRSSYDEAGVTALVEPFFDAMGLAWGACECAVSRAGAGSVAEAWANHVPTLFLPYPYHRDQHQRQNAEPLRRVGGAMIETDHIEATLNMVQVAPKLLELMANPAKRDAMRAALASLGPVDGADRLARALLE
ncbi:MAG: UDP-N-acetylglucosamine--N-acetylmuramyl-(pentapeptide) pyrophosphoryl-undecaprenol N-acetylglucosamine transferase [Phycisphaerales bacterium]|nr:UDP-N-acetylglucosamine--N-acetylmuramyl-(pentapeptide) pyrophosphoryl-undecaprenol N-acetylglucosamine transferase [Phycisphaerales bacterium]